MKRLKIFIDYSKDLYQYSKGLFMKCFIFMLLASFLSGVGILLLIPLLALIGIGDMTTKTPFLEPLVYILKSYSMPLRLSLMMFLYILIMSTQAMVQAKEERLKTKLIQGYTQRLQENLFKDVVHVSWQGMTGMKQTDITNAFSIEIAKISSGTVIFLRLLTQVIMALVQLGISWILSRSLTVFVILCAVVILVGLKRTFRHSTDLGEKIRYLNQQLMARLVEQLQGVKEVKSYGIEDKQVTGYEALTKVYEKEMNRFTDIRTRSTVIYKTAAALVIAMILYVALIALQVPVSSLLVMIYIFARLWPSFSEFHTNIQRILMMLPTYESLKSMQAYLSENEEKIRENSNQTGVSWNLKEGIRFENVHFTYEGERAFQLEIPTLCIESKTTTAIVGESGSGKSTLVNLLLGLLVVTTGEISVDGKSIQKDFRHWRQEIGYVPQESMMIHGSIRDNLTYFVPDKSDKELEEAIELADAKAFIERLPKGWDTIVGDMGIRLSGGQRQRIVLARALLRQPQVLILDEATSALDHFSEKKIQKAIEGLDGKMTIILVAHRMTTVRHAKRILVMKEGKIVEDGTYDQLIKQKGVFSRLDEEVREASE